MRAADIYRYWDSDLRAPLVSALRMMSAEQLRWKPPGWRSSALDLTLHLCEAEWGWITCNALQEASWKEGFDASGLDTLEGVLSRWRGIHGRTLRWLEETPTSGLFREHALPYHDMPAAPMAWIVHHVMEHEAHHRGQVFMLMRMQGLTPPET